MTPERWQQINAVLDVVLERPPAQREAYLRTHHAADAALCARVMELAEAYEEAGPFLETPIAGQVAPLIPEGAERRAGPYRLLRRIARGGMGTVYLATRDDEHFQKQVAVKLIRRGMDTDDVLRRFLRERQILAHLEHPHIARLIDGGVTDEDRPYFVMEYVEGLPIDAYCDQQRLSVFARLTLFLDVCEAVRYAHQMLVVHRDLKPSNILVSEGQTVKLLDFGIATVLSDDSGGDLTKTGMRVMTPEYAAPEQIRGEAVTTATDVYALGVLLYKLLTGRLPYRVLGLSAHEVERVILEAAPARPSTAVTTVAPAGEDAVDLTPETISRMRDTSISMLRRHLSGDLDTIVLKALSKETGRRYPSVEAFEEDVRRYLAGLPVRARKDTLWYRAAKFSGRHRFGVAATLVILVLLLSYAATASVQARRIGLERDKAEQVAAFMADLFTRADPFESADDLSVRDVLERGAARVDRDLAGQPEVQAQLLAIIARVYQNLGLYEAALPPAERALALRRRVYGDHHPDVAASLNDLADVVCFLGDYETSDSLYRVALGLRRSLLGARHEAVAETLTDLGLLLYYKGDRAESEQKLREALALERTLQGARHPRVAEAMHTLAAVLYPTGKTEQAEALVREALAIRRAVLPSNHPTLAPNMSFLAEILRARGDYEAAELLLQEALVLHRRLGDDHPYVATSLIGLARLRRDQGRRDEATTLFQQALVLRRLRLGDDHPETIRALKERDEMRQGDAGH